MNAFLSWFSLHPLLAAGGVAINLAAFFLYGLDKLWAVTASRRVRERTLLLLALLGGSLGAWAGVLVFRHKTRKNGFIALLTIILLVHIAAIVAAFGDSSLSALTGETDMLY